MFWFSIITRGALIGITALLGFAGVALAQTSSSNPLVPPSLPFLNSTTSDPWFWTMVGAWLFSSIVSGMPEPEKTDSKFYIWIYRSFHLIAASGTSYFQHRSKWPDPVKAEEQSKT